MDIGTISLILLIGMLTLLAIGMPLGFASGFLAVVVMVLKFEPTLVTDPFVYGFDFAQWTVGSGVLSRSFGTGPMNILAQRLYGITTNYVLISVPLFIFMATLLERSGIARDMYSCLNMWMARTRGGIAVVTALMAIVMAAMSGIIGGEVVLLGLIACGPLLYGAVGLAGMVLGGNFLDYSVLSADPVKGQQLGILLIEAGVGISVTGVLLAIFHAFAARGR